MHAKTLKIIRENRLDNRHLNQNLLCIFKENQEQNLIFFDWIL